jgi:hypothetical protein
MQEDYCLECAPHFRSFSILLDIAIGVTAAFPGPAKPPQSPFPSL